MAERTYAEPCYDWLEAAIYAEIATRNRQQMATWVPRSDVESRCQIVPCPGCGSFIPIPNDWPTATPYRHAHYDVNRNWSAWRQVLYGQSVCHRYMTTNGDTIPIWLPE